jgi:hypothetical protein
MFCPSCGAETAEGLSYCKRCGAPLRASSSDAAAAASRVTSLIWAVSLATALITLGGFIVIGVILIERAASASNVAFGLLALLLVAVVFVAAMLTRQLSRLISFYMHSSVGDAAEQHRLERQPAPAHVAAEPGATIQGQFDDSPRAALPSAGLERPTRLMDQTPPEREPR